MCKLSFIENIPIALTLLPCSHKGSCLDSLIEKKKESSVTYYLDFTFLPMMYFETK